MKPKPNSEFQLTDPDHFRHYNWAERRFLSFALGDATGPVPAFGAKPDPGLS